MNSPRPELPNDIPGCHGMIEQLHAELQLAAERIAELESATVEAQEIRARIAHLEALLAGRGVFEVSE